MNRLVLIPILILALFVISCSKEDETQTFQYEGNWSGIYSGDEDNGTWAVNVNSSGVLTGNTTSLVFGQTFQMSGNVTQNGVITAVLGTATSGGQFNGQFTGTTASGTWTNNLLGISGTWSGNKQ